MSDDDEEASLTKNDPGNELLHIDANEIFNSDPSGTVGDDELVPYRPTADQFERMLRLQESETNHRQREFSLRQSKQRNQYNITRRLIDQQPQLRKFAFMLLALVATLITFVLSVALFVNKEQVAMQIIQAIVFFLGGGAGGYALGQRQTKGNSNTPKPPAPPNVS